MSFFGWPRFGFLVTYNYLNNYLSRAYFSVCNRCSTTCQSFHIFVFICFNVYNVGSKKHSDGEGVGPPPPWLRYLLLATPTCNRTLQPHWKHLELPDFLTIFLPTPCIWWCDWLGLTPHQRFGFQLNLLIPIPPTQAIHFQIQQTILFWFNPKLWQFWLQLTYLIPISLPLCQFWIQHVYSVWDSTHLPIKHPIVMMLNLLS